LFIILHIKIVIAVAQFFGLFPVVNVLNKDVNKIRFKAISLRTFHAMAWLVSAAVFSVLETLHLYNLDNLNPKNIS
jgi:hypothetical protein